MLKANRERSCCPVCGRDDLQHEVTISAQESANHLIPPRRSPQRNEAMVEAVRELWGQDDVAIQHCAGCDFGFADPFVAGNMAIYNLLGDGDQHYPGNRFEFRETLSVLERRRSPLRLLEVGAGAGAFVNDIVTAGVASSITVLEYDDGAVAHLRKIPGCTVVQEDLQTFSKGTPGRFDAICMFQVLEHMDRLDSVFDALNKLCAPDGDVFIAVPNAERIAIQERLTHFMDMPPIHIGRWSTSALETLARRHNFALAETRRSFGWPLRELWHLARYRLEARTRRPDSVTGGIERICYRPIRGALKRCVAVWDLLWLARYYGNVPPTTNWFHLCRPEQ